jgi:outer membrane protein assembly factor BamA
MRVLGVALAVAIITLTPVPASADVGDYIGKPVGSVRLELDGRETNDQTLLAVVETQPGRPLSMAEVRESVMHLFSLGRFEDVQVHAVLAGGSVALRYDLAPIHHVGKVAFAGDLHVPGVDTGQLRQAIVERFGASPPVGRAADVARLLVDELRQRG